MCRYDKRKVELSSLYIYSNYSKMYRQLCLFCFGILILNGCKSKNSADPTLDLSSQFYSQNGIDPIRNTVGTLEDYKQESWEPWVRELFAPLDTGRLPNTPPSMDAKLVVYPNPAILQQEFSVGYKTDSLNVKVVMVNRYKEPLLRVNLQLNSSSQSGWVLSYQNVDRKGDSLFRIYYAFSTRSAPYFHTSHADITLGK